ELTISPPASTAPFRRGEVDGRATRNRDLPQFALRRIRNPPSVGRREWPAVLAALFALTGAGNRPHAHLVEWAMENGVAPIDQSGNEELAAVGTQTHDRREGGLYTRIEHDAEPC